MAHREQREFCEAVRRLFPDHFRGRRVLDIGSLDVNGTNRGLFAGCDYTGIDLGPGPNVDVVVAAHMFEPDEEFELVISTEALEHDRHWRETLCHVVHDLLLGPGGLFLFTCATAGRPEHGTSGRHPGDSPFTNDYYRNLTEADVRSAIDVEACFAKHRFDVLGTDLRFWGVLK